MALLAYPKEHYDYWRDLGLELPAAGAMGENLTVAGLPETDVCIGDVFEVGTCLIQVTETRSTCYKLAARFGRKDMGVLMQDAGFTGYLFRVLVCGELGAGDSMTLVRCDQLHTMTVAEAGRIMNVDRKDLVGAQRLYAVSALEYSFSGGPVPLQLRSVIDDGAALAFEYVCGRWGPADLIPQAGSAVYVRSPSGLLEAVRIYDDVSPPPELFEQR